MDKGAGFFDGFVDGRDSRVHVFLNFFSERKCDNKLFSAFNRTLSVGRGYRRAVSIIAPAREDARPTMKIFTHPARLPLASPATSRFSRNRRPPGTNRCADRARPIPRHSAP